MVKQLTKTCYGLRPAYLMVETMKALTKALGFKTLLGIPQNIKINRVLFKALIML